MEAYRRLAEAAAMNRPVASVDAHDSWYLKGGTTAEALASVLPGRQFVLARRRGKLLLLDTDGDGPVLGLRFGMSGRLVVDGAAGVEGLLYSTNVAKPSYDSFILRFQDGGDLRMRDPRRLGGVQLDPYEDRLGPDALSITLGDPNGNGLMTIESSRLNAAFTPQQIKDQEDQRLKSQYPDTKPCPNSTTTAITLNNAKGLFWTNCFTYTSGTRAVPEAAAFYASASADGTVYWMVSEVTAPPSNLQAVINECKAVVQGIQWKLT